MGVGAAERWDQVVKDDIYDVGALQRVGHGPPSDARFRAYLAQLAE